MWSLIDQMSTNPHLRILLKPHDLWPVLPKLWLLFYSLPLSSCDTSPVFLCLNSLFMKIHVALRASSLQYDLKLRKWSSRTHFPQDISFWELLWNIILRCIAFVYAVKHLFHDAKMYYILLRYICLTLWSGVRYFAYLTPDWSNQELNSQ